MQRNRWRAAALCQGRSAMEAVPAAGSADMAAGIIVSVECMAVAATASTPQAQLPSAAPKRQPLASAHAIQRLAQKSLSRAMSTELRMQ